MIKIIILDKGEFNIMKYRKLVEHKKINGILAIMKIKRVILPTITMVIIASQLFGCASTTKQEAYDMMQETEQIELEYAVPDYDSNAEESKVELLPWLQLSSLETHPELRTAFEELLGVTVSEDGTKTGIIYTDETGKANQNNTLFNALGSTNLFIDTIRDTEKSEKIESIASDNYTDIEDNQSIAAVINAYFELLPDQEDGQFDGDSTISRAQAMTLLMRATTPVNEQQAPETDSNFTAKVGETIYTDFAAPMDDYCYISTSNGLNKKSFESTMSRGEYIYMLTKALFGDDYSSQLEEAGKEETDVDSVTFTTLKDGGDVTYQEALNSPDKGLPTDMFNTFKKAVAIGFVTEDNLNWDEAITKSEAINLFIDAVEVYQINMEEVNNKMGLEETPPYEVVEQGDYPDSRSDHQANWDTYKKYFDDFSVYGTDTAGKGLNDLPYCGNTGYNAKLLQERTTDKGYTVLYDTDTGKVYYSSMILPTGDAYDEDKSSNALVQYIIDNDIFSVYDLTYSQFQEILGVYNGD